MQPSACPASAYAVPECFFSGLLPCSPPGGEFGGKPRTCVPAMSHRTLRWAEPTSLDRLPVRRVVGCR